MSTTQTRVDPVTAAVIAGALDSIAVEMGHKLARMAYSSIIRESEDYGCVLCDAQGRQACARWGGKRASLGRQALAPRTFEGTL